MHGSRALQLSFRIQGGQVSADKVAILVEVVVDRTVDGAEMPLRGCALAASP